MTHIVPFVLCVGGFAALALATHRQQRDLLGRALPPATTQSLRWGGWSLLGLALAWLLAQPNPGLGLVIYSGHTTLAAGIVYLGLVAWRRRQTG